MQDGLNSKLFPLKEIEETQPVLSSGHDFYAGQLHKLHIYISETQ